MTLYPIEPRPPLKSFARSIRTICGTRSALPPLHCSWGCSSHCAQAY